MMFVFRDAFARGTFSRLFLPVALFLIVLPLSSMIALPALPGGIAVEAKPWEEADKLFRGDRRWLGGDAAYSVDLGGGRVLWLFGDSFVANAPTEKRSESTMVHNTVAIQTGYDPSHSSIRFYWRNAKEPAPEAFVSEEGNSWLWPEDGVRVGGKLLLFFTQVRSSKRIDSLGFENFGWTAYIVDNPGEEPPLWNLGDLSSPEWWCGFDRGWVKQKELARLPSPVFSEGAMEFSVTQDVQHGEFLEVQNVGFGASDIAVREADRLEGPWSQAVKVYRPPESDRPGAFVYAAKAHTELTGANLVVTYVANSSNDRILASDMSIYYPRFVRLHTSIAQSSR